MSERIEPLHPDQDPDEQITLEGQTLNVHFDVVLPTDYRRSLCLQHLIEGHAVAAQAYFFASEVQLPDEDQEQLIRFRFECAGRTAVGGCGLHVVQYDRNGNKIG